jgi:hypothetical protein
MKLYDLDKLIRDNKQDNLYNLYDPTFKLETGINLRQFVVGPEQVMRIDLVCNEIYKSVNQVDFLCDLNNIDNPLNVKEGDVILYPNFDAISYYRVTITDNNDARAKLLNVNKSTKRDNNRQKYVEQNFALPPNVKQVPDASVKIENGQIVIGG